MFRGSPREESCLGRVSVRSLHSGGREVVRVGHCLYQANLRTRQPYSNCRFMTFTYILLILTMLNDQLTVRGIIEEASQ